MLDPLSGLSLASNIINVIDFTTKVVKGTVEIHGATSGSTITNHEVELVASDLASLFNRLPNKAAASSSGQWDEDQALKDLATQCEGLASELLDKLNKLKPAKRHKPWSSFGTALACVWSGRQVREYVRRLEMLQTNLITRLVTILS